jgi:hypothetical protein
MRWKILGGAGLAGILAGLIVVGRSPVALGDTAATTTPPNDPFSPPPPGPGTIPYDQLSPAGQADIDQIQQTIELGQPASSYAAFSAATDQAVIDSQAEIAARQVGLESTEQDGVVP